MQPTNLYEYYKSQGQALPSIADRAGDAAKAGIQGAYTGTADQNNQLLSYYDTLSKPQTSQSTSTPSSTPSAVSNYNMGQKVTDIVNKSTNLGVLPQKTNSQLTNNPQTNQQNTTVDYSSSPYSTDAMGNKVYYNPASGQYDQYEVKNGVVNYGGISVPSTVLSDPALKSIVDNQLNAQKTNKTALDAELESIKNRFIQYRDTQNQLNESGKAAVQNALLQTGAGGRGSISQYSAATADSRVNVMVQDGMKKLQELDNQEQSLISAARQAYQSKDYKILDKINSAIEQKRQKALAVSTEFNKNLAKEQVAAREKAQQAIVDQDVASIYSQGITDPTQIMSQLKEQGKSYSLAQINDVIKNVATNLGTDVAGLDQTTREFYRLKQAKGLPVYISSLPTEGEQLLAYVKARTGAETKGKAVSSSVSGGTYSGVSGTLAGGNRGVYNNDLDLLIDTAKNNISTKFGQSSFQDSINKARNDTDKITILASQVVKGLPANERTDFTNQTFAIKQVDKALDLLNSGVKTGVMQSGTQYLYNTTGKDFDPKLAKINQLITSAIQPYRNSVTGAAWGDQEEAEYQNLFGSTKYSPEELKQRLQGVKDIMKDKTINALRSSVDPLSQQSNIFETSNAQYAIKAGDELRNIASEYGTTVDVLKALNPGINERSLVVGSKLNLPIDGVHTNTQDPLGLNLGVSNANDPLGIR